MMTKQRTRRAWLAGMAAALAPLVLGGRAGATPIESAPGNGASFERVCKEVGGTFDRGKYSTSCTYKTGDIKVCDEKGYNCTWHPAELVVPTGPLGSLPPLTNVTAQPAVDSALPATESGKAHRKKGRSRRRHSRR